MGQAAALKLEDTQFLLEQWGKWVLSGGVASIGYPCIQPFRQLLGSSVKSLSITDEQALRIDATLAKLKKRDYEMGRVVITYYLSGTPVTKLADLLDMPLAKTRTLLQSGIAWIDAALEFNTPDYQKAV